MEIDALVNVFVMELQLCYPQSRAGGQEGPDDILLTQKYFCSRYISI